MKIKNFIIGMLIIVIGVHWIYIIDLSRSASLGNRHGSMFFMEGYLYAKEESYTPSTKFGEETKKWVMYAAVDLMNSAEVGSYTQRLSCSFLLNNGNSIIIQSNINYTYKLKE